MARKGSGIEVRGDTMRLTFKYQGEWIKERFTENGQPLKPTPANLAYAERAAEEIKRIVALDESRRPDQPRLFRIEDYFPDSKRAKKEDETRQRNTFANVADLWLDSRKGELQPASYHMYHHALKKWKAFLVSNKPLGEYMMDEIDAREFHAAVGKFPWSSAKHFNNILVPLRMVFEFEFRGERMFKNPFTGIKTRRLSKKKVDCLTENERDTLLAYMKEKYDPRVYAYFLFAFYTGMRVEELIALQWGDVDWNKKKIMVQRVRTFHGKERSGTKTQDEGEGRLVDLRPEAIAALNIMKPYTFMLGATEKQETPDIFQNPTTGRPWRDDQRQRADYWNPARRHLGMRAVPPRNTRHTYANWLLMMGVSERYIKKQLGHTDGSPMLAQHYTRWDEGDEHERYREQVDKLIDRTIQGRSGEENRVISPNKSQIENRVS